MQFRPVHSYTVSNPNQKRSPQIDYFLKQVTYYLDQLSASEIKEAQKIFEARIDKLYKQNIHISSALLESTILVELGEPKEAAHAYLRSKGKKPRDPDEPSTAGKFARSRGIRFFIVLIIAAVGWHLYYGPNSVTEAKKLALTISGKVGLEQQATNALQITSEKKEAEARPDLIQKPSAIGNISMTSVLTSANQPIREISVEFERGNWYVYWSKDMNLNWKCSGVGAVEASVGGTSLQLKTAPQAHLNCNLILPFGKGLKIKGQEGQIALQEPDTVTTAEMKNGTISFRSSPRQKYVFRNNIKSGMMGNLESSNDPYAIPIYMSVENGKIVGQ